MELGIQLHLTGLSPVKTVFILDILGIHRARSTVHNWVHKADLQLVPGQNPDQITVDEMMIPQR